jgi:hypothetical protein
MKSGNIAHADKTNGNIVLPPFQNTTCHSGFSMYIPFIMHVDIIYIYIYRCLTKRLYLEKPE